VVDDVDNTVAGIDVGGGDLGVVDVDVILVQKDFYVLAFESLDLFMVLEVGGMHGARSDVVKEDILEVFDVFGVKEEIKEGLAVSVQKFCNNSHGERAPQHRPAAEEATKV
jgi:hypothetical protein